MKQLSRGSQCSTVAFHQSTLPLGGASKWSQLNRGCGIKPAPKLRPTTLASSNSASSISTLKSLKEDRGNLDEKTKEYMKKIIFDNKELCRRNKELEERNDSLEIEMRQLTQRCGEFKRGFLALENKKSTGSNGEERPPIKLVTFEATSQVDVFDPDRITQNQVRAIVKDMTASANFRSSHKHSLSQSIQSQKNKSDLKILKDMTNNLDQSQYTSKSVSIILSPVNFATQTESKYLCQDTSQPGSGNHEAQLTQQVNKYKYSLQEMERKYLDMSARYQKIRSIIGGGKS